MPIRLLAATALALCLGVLPALAQDQSVVIPTQTVDQALRARLPESIRTAGRMTSVNSGSFPPYEIVTSPTEEHGATADLCDAVAQLLGIKIDYATAAGLSAILTGIKAGRYQLSMGPDGDFKSREEANDFVDWVQEYVVFAVQKGNPTGIDDLADACGKKIAVQAGGSAEKVIKDQSDKCTEAGKPAVAVQSYPDQPTAILAVRSHRADAFFSSQAPLTYFVQQSNGELQLAAVGKSNGFDNLYQGAVVPKGTPLAGVLKDAILVLQKNGTYAAIMKKWGLDRNMIAEAGIDLAKN